MQSQNEPITGSIPYSIGISSVVRIPIPGTGGLCIELRPRGYIPVGGSTSTLFFQDSTGRRYLRLDYGYNVRTKTIDYHWNQTGTYKNFGLHDHAKAGRAGAGVYHATKYFRYAGRVLLIAGAGIDIVSVVVASSPIRRATEVASGWALAWVGCKAVGAGGAIVGSAASPIGTAIGGLSGCVIGGYAGYRAGNVAGDIVYDWAHTIFSPVPQVEAP